jgi:hypothetical protein
MLIDHKKSNQIKSEENEIENFPSNRYLNEFNCVGKVGGNYNFVLREIDWKFVLIFYFKLSIFCEISFGNFSGKLENYFPTFRIKNFHDFSFNLKSK